MRISLLLLLALSGCARVVFTRTEGGVPQVWRMRAGGEKVTRLTRAPEGCERPAMDGLRRWIVYSSLRGGNRDIYLAGYDGENERRLTSDPAEDDQPFLSRDASRVLFVSRRGGDHPQVWIMNADGTEQRALTSGRADNEWPVFDPEARRIAWSASLGGGPWHVYLMVLESMEIEDATAAGEKVAAASHRAPAFSHNGRMLLFLRTDPTRGEEGDLWQMRVDGGDPAPQPLLEMPGRQWGCAFFPSDRWVVFTTATAPDGAALPSSEVYAYDIEHRVLQRLTENQIPDETRSTWLGP